MVRAAAFHDYAWLRYETSPLIHPETGEPYQFLQVPLGATQLEAYQWSLDWLAGIDRYAGLIISMHRTGLWKNRYETITHPSGYNLREIIDHIDELRLEHTDQSPMDHNGSIFRQPHDLSLNRCTDNSIELL